MDERYIITAVAKSLKVLKLFKSSSAHYTLAELTQLSGMNKSNVLRILNTLESENFLYFDSYSKTYILGSHFNSIMASFSYSDLKNLIHEDLVVAAKKSNVLIHFTIKERDTLVMLERVFPGNINSLIFASNEGEEVPLHATGAGKIIAAFSPLEERKRLISNCNFNRYTENTITDKDEFINLLEQIRKDGFALNKCEHEEFLCCLTRPIFYENGTLAGALSFSGYKEVFTSSNYDRINEISKYTVLSIQKKLGYEAN